VGIKLYNKLPNTIKRLNNIQEFKGRQVFFTATHFLFSGWIYVLLDSTVTQLPIIMYTLFLVFCNSIKQDTKKVYINMWVLIILYITVFHYWCKCIASPLCYVYCEWMFFMQYGECKLNLACPMSYLWLDEQNARIKNKGSRIDFEH
jgi:hypothetical protein